MKIDFDLIQDKLKESASKLTISFVVFLMVVWLLRLFEYIYIKNVQDVPEGSLLLEIASFRYDVYYVLNVTGLLILPYFLISVLSVRFAVFFSRLVFILLVLAQIPLMFYFGATSLMLSTDLFGYSLDEIIKISGAAGGFSILKFLPFVIVIAGWIFIFRFVDRLKISYKIYLPFVLLSFIYMFFTNSLVPSAKEYKSEIEFNLANNKFGYFANKSFNYFFNQPDPTEKSLYAYFYTEIKSSKEEETNFISSDFPFLRKDKTHDVLGHFFNVGNEKPNIVFIIVESLGRAYCGEGAYLKSFTPFVDSLMSQSLYWENFLSTAGRTFEVLPSLLGSLPYGNTGFCELGEHMPKHQSIVRLLKENGYHTSFYYGGDAKFDNMEIFMKMQGIDKIYDEKSFGPGYTKLPKTSSDFTWGYGDKDIFRKVIEETSKQSKSPRLDICLTLAMHDPYLIPEQDKYITRFEGMMNKFKLSDEKKNDYRKYKQNFSTIIYFDDAIRSFFKEFSKRDDFKNTIFIITGDHRMSTPPIATQIDRFHVPLIIYSPMLKRAEKFSSISSQLFVTPSMVAFLRENYKMKFPEVCHWMGQELDTVRSFRCNCIVPFIRTKSEIIDYLNKDYFLSGEQLFTLPGSMFIEPVEDPVKFTELNSLFDKFKSNNKFACDNNKLAPDSIFK